MHGRIKTNEMKYIIHIFILAIYASILFSCGGGKKQQSSSSTENSANDTSSIKEIPTTIFDDNWNKLDQNNTILTEEEFDSLKLNSLSFIGSYGDLQYEKSKTLIDQENRKLLTIKTISSGEISEYLLGYVDQNISDSLLVAYEDNVEYYSKVSSTISHDTITVMAINWDYSGLEEISDTIVSRYIITPALKFEEIIEE